MKALVIGTRGSQLALAQTNFIADQLLSIHPDLEITIKIIQTTGDKFDTASLAALSGETKGLFVKEIEEALLNRQVDLAVHSLKDVPTQLPDGLSLGAVPRRENPFDCYVSEDPVNSLADLPEGARIGTSSYRRSIQLAALRPDLEIQPIRGNIDTRMRKVRNKQFHGVVLAAAGLKRLGMERRIRFSFGVEQMVPAIGQGALALEIRSDDAIALEVLKPLDHSPTAQAVEAERSFLEEMGGGCQLPIGALARVDPHEAYFDAYLSNRSGEQIIKHSLRGDAESLRTMVTEMIELFRSKGGRELMREVDE